MPLEPVETAPSFNLVDPHRSTQVADLPHVDEHTTVVEASVDDVWAALVETLDRAFSGTGAASYARLVGCADSAASGPRPLSEGSSIPGFQVVTAVPGSELVLAGHHRFSSYALMFRIEPLGARQSRLRAETRAAFPGVGGSVYRTLVVGTRGHAFAVRRLLSGVRHAVERQRSGASSRAVGK